MHLLAIALGEQVRHQCIQVGGCEAGAALDALVHLKLKARQCGHNEKVAMKVGERLFKHINLERLLCV